MPCDMDGDIHRLVWHGGGRDDLLGIGGWAVIREILEWAFRQGLGRLRGVHQVDNLSVVKEKIPGRKNYTCNGCTLGWHGMAWHGAELHGVTTWFPWD